MSHEMMNHMLGRLYSDTQKASVPEDMAALLRKIDGAI